MDLYESYFAEYCIRRKYLDCAIDKFLYFLHPISLVYHPPSCDEALVATAQEDSSSSVAVAAGAEAAASPTATAASAAASTTFPASDIGKFNLNFELDSDDDIEDIADGSADMFM